MDGIQVLKQWNISPFMEYILKNKEISVLFSLMIVW